MTLFHCSWSDLDTILVDAKDEDHAKAMATELADGAAPEKVRALPVGAFACSVEIDDDESAGDDGEEVSPAAYLDPFPITSQVLAVFEEATEGPACGAVATIQLDSGPVPIACERPSGHAQNHEAVTESGEVFEW